MGEKFAVYIATHQIEIIFGIIFCLAGVILSVISGGKKNNDQISNNTTVIEMKKIVQNNVKVTNNYYNNNNQNSNNSGNNTSQGSGNDDIWGLLGLGFIAAVIYAKNHETIMTIILAFSLITLVFLSIIAIKLSRNEQLDKLNKHWILTGFMIICYNFLSLVLMQFQNVDSGSGLTGLTRIFTYMVGFLIQIGPNVFLLLILVYLFSLNMFLLKPNKINKFFLRKLHWLTNDHKVITGIVVFSLVFSVLLSSGLVYKFVDMVSKNNQIQLQNLTQ